jgi:hypothetical protein
MTREQRRKYMREWKRRNPEKVRDSARKRSKTAAFRAYQSAWKKARRNGPHRQSVLDAQRKRWLRTRDVINARRRGGGAKLTLEDFRKMVRKSHGKCAVCRARMVKVCVDHDHKTGRVRGLLCSGCNTFAGYLDKRGHLLKTMLRYISKGKS